MRAVKHSSRAGFSILELSVVLTVIALIIGSALAVGATRIQAAKIQDTETKMKAISDVLDSFVQNYGYIPCPANPQALITDADFGDGVVDGSGNCTALNLLGSGTNYRIGVVPTKTLKLAPSVMMDGWNRRITYVMDTRLSNATKYAASNPDSLTDRTNHGGAGDPLNPDFLVVLSAYPRVLPAETTTVTNKAVVLFLSYGSDGHGAWKAKGGATKIVADPDPTTIGVLQDQNDNKENSTIIDNVFVQKFRTETFDDVIYYRMQWQFPCITSSSIVGNRYVCH